MEITKVWTTYEIELESTNGYENPYAEVEVWADLKGPGFERRVYGFWDGGRLFRIRVTATGPGSWSYITGSNMDDTGLVGQIGTFHAENWSEDEKVQNPCRRGIIRVSENGRGFVYADQTPVYILADTEWALFTHRYPWQDGDPMMEPGPDMGFKGVVKARQKQGFNAVATLCAFPGWQDDGQPSWITVNRERGLHLRQGWRSASKSRVNGTETIMDMGNEGGYPFEFPGKVPGYENTFPDMDRVNPVYFQYIDRKIDWLNDNGFTVFIETVRRDCSSVWKEYYRWPDSFARFFQYMIARYQTNNCLFSPIHYDSSSCSIPARDYNEPANLVVDKYGRPPFGTLCGTNAHGSTLVNFGHIEEARWLDYHQIGNYQREHDLYWYLTEIFETEPHVPGLNGEPYYPGDVNGNGPDRIQVPGNTEEADRRCRSGLYGSFLSGGLAGYFYGAEGMWSGTIEEEAHWKYWDAFTFESGNQIHHINQFAAGVDEGYHNLIPSVELVTPNKLGYPRSYRGWAFCARTSDFETLLLYFEKDCSRASVRGLPPGSEYLIQWFDPRSGQWLGDDEKILLTDEMNRIALPAFPSNEDWGLCMKKMDGQET